MKITHCTCHEVSFAEIRELADSMLTAETNTVNIEALQKELAFGNNCGMCLPYIKQTLKTGETVFRELITDNV